TAFENVSFFNTGPAFQAYVLIRNRGTTSRKFEFFIRGIAGNLQFFNDGSTVSPSNSLEDRAITVGVVNFNNYNQDNPPLEPFCSRGPTNGGRIVPDLCAMDGCTAVSYPPGANGIGGFFGASAGGPNLMGFLAAFWSEHNYLSQDELLEVVFKLASNYNDWGDPGKDNSYGHGGVYVPTYRNKTRFIYKALNNTNANADGPFIDMDQADNLVNQNSNLFFLGETFDGTTSGPTIIRNPNIYRSAGVSSYIKE
ncbi:MAG: S8 family serine peptidase, partial [Bacteroidota bacterium]